MTTSTIVKTCLASVIIALVVYFVYQFVDLRRGNFLTNVAPADCLVILGASVWPGAQPSPVLRDRIARAAELYHQGVAKKIICSGGVGKYPPAEAEVCKQNLMKANVAANDIIMELASHSTADQAVIIKKICDGEGFKSIALVTSFYHEKRALKLFRGAGFNDIQDAHCTHERFEDLNYWVARDALALTVMNWWHWIAIGLGIALPALMYQAIRRRNRATV
jgi:vancomycin permeability regulator SanA